MTTTTHPEARSAVAQRLIDAAVAAIDTDGEASIRVQEIVAEAGAQIPALYRNFGNREGLVQAAQIDRLVRDLDTEVGLVMTAMNEVQDGDEFRALVDATLQRISNPERRALRWKRISILGSTYGRPALAEAVGELEAAAIQKIAAAFRRPQELGWIRADLDLEAFASWFAGQTLGRILIELGEPRVDSAAWDAIAAEAVTHILFN
jgi:AcrR family transcriptional regulator